MEMIVGRHDGILRALSRIGADGVRTDIFKPSDTRRSAGDWKRLIIRDCGAALFGADGSVRAAARLVQIQQFSVTLAEILAAERDLVRRPNRLRTVLDVLLSVLLSRSSFDEWIMSAPKRTNEPVEHQVTRTANAIWAPLKEAVEVQLDDLQIVGKERERVTTFLWEYLWTRIQTALAAPPLLDEGK